MKISNQYYDIGKWVVLIFMPSFAVFISGVGELYGWIETSTIVTTINLMTVFLGSLLQISSQKYHGNSSGTGGNSNGQSYS